MRFIKPGRIDGMFEAPSSKSEFQRVTAAAALAPGRSEVLFHSLCDDSLASLRAARGLGASISRTANRIVIEGGQERPEDILDCGESGLCLRMFAPLAALFPHEVTLTGRGSLLTRPIAMLEDSLRQAGVSCRSRNGFPPLTVRGPLSGGKIRVDGAITSQPVTGLLMALPLAKEDSRLTVVNFTSRPYLELTLSIMAQFGIMVESQLEDGQFLIPGGQRYHPQSWKVEGDWSGTSFLLVAGAIAGRVSVKNLNIDSWQADKAVLKALERCGAAVNILPDERGHRAEVRKRQLAAFEFDAADCPDLFPPLAALACYCRGTSIITGVHRLRHKESDRAAALIDVLGTIGAKLNVKGDALHITGSKISGGRVDSHGDHRIAMAAAVAALGSERGVEIMRPECVAKSYPRFFKDLELLKEKP
jgi:3-phosphoshikimate 1-carboxyvinyltransferase